MSDGMLGLIGVIISLVVSSIIAKCNQNNNKKQNDENKETQHIIQSSQKEFEVQMLARQQEFQEKLTQKQIKADVILKSRLHWIDNTKSIASEFLIDVLRIVTLDALLVNKYISIKIWRDVEQKNISSIQSDNTNSDDKDFKINFDIKAKKIIDDQIESISKINNEINDLMYKTSKEYTLLLLNFSENDENNNIIKSIKAINNDLRRVTTKVEEAQSSFGDDNVDWIKINNSISSEKAAINQKVEELTIILRDYYKKEWEKVKAGE
ncbi:MULTISPECIES: class 1 fructose-bisphosphatase [Enterococcus]|uniref:class 1 fructose-bisphosphatase n=1 Tax=Enterococcus TaxID=1350 RepID=UPI000C25E6C0|nr:class 1 fructose-bisphosphatase [Enterococcus mundtii]PJK27106.1 hypothetical protein CV769_01645 [Enterococcus mundtii]